MGSEMCIRDSSDTVYNGVDTLVGYLAFDLDPSYFQTEIFDAAITGETYLADNVDFVKEVAGLHFKDIGPGSSAACYFDLSAPGSIIQLYYHTGVEDTVPKVFNMTFGQNFGDPVGSFNSFAHDFSGADFDLGMMDTLNGEILTYIQGGSGARTMLVFPGLDTLIGKGYSINRAELNFNVVQGTASPYTLPGTLLLVQGTDSAQQLIKDYSSSLSNVGGSVTRADIRSYKYRFNVTRMVHDFVNTKEEILPSNAVEYAKGFAVFGARYKDFKNQEFRRRYCTQSCGLRYTYYSSNPWQRNHRN